MPDAYVDSVGTTGDSSGVDNKDCPVDMPDTVTEGNTLFAFVRPNTMDTVPPAGWTHMGLTNGSVQLFQKTADGTEGGTSVTFKLNSVSGAPVPYDAIVGAYDIDADGGTSVGDGCPPGTWYGTSQNCGGTLGQPRIDTGLDEAQGVVPELWHSVVGCAMSISSSGAMPATRTPHGDTVIRDFVQHTFTIGANTFKVELTLVDHLTWTTVGADDLLGLDWDVATLWYILPRAFQHTTTPPLPSGAPEIELRLLKVDVGELPNILHTRMGVGMRDPFEQG